MAGDCAELNWSGITAEHVAELKSKGYAVVDGFLGAQASTSLLNEMQSLKAEGLLKPNQIAFLQPDKSTIYVTKPHIFELDLHHASLRERFATLDHVFWSAHELAAHVNQLDPSARLRTTPGATTLKVQCNLGKGACFPFHYDNPAAPDKRRLTCLLYLNPDWQPGMGGEVRLAPFLGSPIDVQPRFDRLVLFWSETVLHRVLPCFAERYVLTIWLESDFANQDTYAPPWPLLDQLGDDAHSLRYLAKPSLQRYLSRALYPTAYETSIKECMKGDDGGASVLLRAHRQHVQGVLTNPQAASLVQQLLPLVTPLSD